MRYKKHWEVEGQHAFLGASKYHWIRYDLEKIKRVWENQFKSMRGSRLHNLAKFCIKEKVKLDKNGTTLSLYVNDAIGFGMVPELVLKYSENTFGTADALVFDEERLELRIHDLKTGTHAGNFDQLMVYCALFCWDYDKNPFDLTMFLRIYQMDAVHEIIADPQAVREIMDLMAEFEPHIEEMKAAMG